MMRYGHNTTTHPYLKRQLKEFLDRYKRLKYSLERFGFINATMTNYVNACNGYRMTSEMFENLTLKEKEMSDLMTANNMTQLYFDYPILFGFRTIFYKRIDHELHDAIERNLGTILLNRYMNANVKERIQTLHLAENVESDEDFDRIKGEQDLLYDVNDFIEECRQQEDRLVVYMRMYLNEATEKGGESLKTMAIDELNNTERRLQSINGWMTSMIWN